jgi:hypothetical protein
MVHFCIVCDLSCSHSHDEVDDETINEMIDENEIWESVMSIQTNDEMIVGPPIDDRPLQEINAGLISKYLLFIDFCSLLFK